MKDVVRVEVETTLGEVSVRRVAEVPAPPYGAETALVTGLLRVLEAPQSSRHTEPRA